MGRMTGQWIRGAMLAPLSLLAAGAAWAQEAGIAVPEPTVDKGDVTWMLISTMAVFLMILPGLALFYSGLVRTKS